MIYVNQPQIDHIVNKEMKDLKTKLFNGSMSKTTAEVFLSDSSWGDELNLRELIIAQNTFVRLSKEYINEHHKGEYIVLKDCNVRIGRVGLPVGEYLCGRD